MKTSSRRRVGFAVLALVFLIAGVFILMTAGAGDSVNMGTFHASRTTLERRTNYAAYGSMQLALDELSNNMTYSCDAQGVAVPGDPDLIYDLRIDNNYDGSLAPNPTAAGVSVPKGMAYIETKSDFRAYVGRYTSKVYSKAYLGNYENNYAVVGTDQVTITNSTVDAYYVRDNGSGVFTLKVSTSGRIATNSVIDGGLSLVGPSTVIDTSLYWGPRGTPTVISDPGPPGVTWNSTSPRVKAQMGFPVRVPRFRPPRDPSDALGSSGIDSVFTSSGNLPVANYKSLTVSNNAVLTLNPGEYFVSGNVTWTNCRVALSGVTAAAPCDIYVGSNVTITNSSVNWENRLGSTDPAAYPASTVLTTGNPADTPPVLDSVALGQQAVLGPRTLRIFFVGSGAPRYKDCTLTAQNNSKISLHASGKAMKVELLSGTEAWGGFKGARFLSENAILHYHKAGSPP